MFDEKFIEEIAAASAKATAALVSEMLGRSNQTPKNRIRIDGVRGIAEYLTCSTATAQAMVNAGKFPVYRIGRKIFVFSDEVEAGIMEKKL